MKSINELTGLYSLTKTLRFELKPIGKTLEHIERKGILTQDEQRAKEYEQVKDIIDRYHKQFISMCMNKCQLKVKNTGDKKDSLEEYASILSKSKRDTTDEKTLEKIKENLRKQIAKAFKEGNTYGDLFKKELVKNHLPDFVTDEEEKQIIEHFSNFTTYFTGFHENRKNMYSDEAKSTAIAYRLIHENFPRFYDNLRSFAKIADSDVSSHFSEIESAFSLYLNVEHLADMFQLDYFSDTLTQEQIEVYNYIIGGKTEEDGTKVQGINEFVNLYNQQHKDAKLPLLKPLYKMILSDRVALSWLPEEFDNDKDMLTAINEFYDSVHSVVFGNDEGSICHLLKNLVEYDTEHIYISKDNGLTNISQQMFGQYDIFTNVIKKAKKEEFEKNRKLTPREKRNPVLLEEKVNSLFKKEKSFSINYLNSLIADIEGGTIESYFAKLGANDKNGVEDLLTQIEQAYSAAKETLDGKYANVNQSEKATKNIKDLLDAFKSLQHFIKPLLGSGEEADKDNAFSAQLLNVWDSLDVVTPLYNKVRNWLTRKPYSTNKIKLNFENNGNLLNGWVDSKTEKTDNGTQYGGYIFRKKNEIGEYDYYLGISSDTKLFRADGSTLSTDVDFYERLDYYQVKTQTIYGNSYMGNYRDDAQKLLDAYKESVIYLGCDVSLLPKDDETLPAYIKRIKTYSYDVYQEMMKQYNVLESYNTMKSHVLLTLANMHRVNAAIELSKHKEYELDKLFYEIDNMPSKSFGFFPIATSLIECANDREKKPLFLFKISNKDLSFAETYSKGFRKTRGTENLHTLYFRALMELCQGVYDIGTGTVFFRKATTGLKNSTTIHKAHETIANKNIRNAKKTSVFEYDIIKDRRYIYDKFQFHLSININYSEPDKKDTNTLVHDIIRNNGIEHIIGIDRGERHLLYLSLIDLKGNIVKQMTLNDIKQNEESPFSTNYKDLLVEREGNRTEARRNWKKIENIKDLKVGYLSQVVHVIAQMMVEYKAIVVLEDLNMGFMRGRQKIERNVYEQFEHMLIDKLNFYVDKKKDANSSGGLLHGLQLTNKFESFAKLGKQSGCLFYIPAWNTSKIDPVTGFVNMLDTRYENIDNSRIFFSKFDSICYNEEKDWFEFTFDYNNFHKKLEGTKTKWTLCTYGTRIRTFRNPAKLNQWDNEEVILTDEFKKAFANAGINICGNLKESICSLSERKHLESLMQLMKPLLQLRNSMTNSEVDYMLSPVSENGVFYDSRSCGSNLPIDADANGAYNIARKGLWVLRQIQQSHEGDKVNLALSNKEWLQFVQDKRNFE